MALQPAGKPCFSSYHGGVASNLKVTYTYGKDESNYLCTSYHWKGWALKIETFLGPEITTSEASAIWAQKSRDLLGHMKKQVFWSFYVHAFLCSVFSAFLDPNETQ